MKTRQIQVILPAISVALMMHLLLFAAMSPKSNVRYSGVPVSPKTTYLSRMVSNASSGNQNVRVIRSPVIFSLPSEMGFSRELTLHDVRTRLTFSQDVETEQFLVADYLLHKKGNILEDEQLLLTQSTSAAPRLPEGIFKEKENTASSRRVHLTPALKSRLAGGVILPSPLNQEPEAPWEVRAAIRVSPGGTVQHVLLDKPLEAASLNQSVLQLLYGLRFKPGSAMEGNVEIYSPEKTTKETAQ